MTVIGIGISPDADRDKLKEIIGGGKRRSDNIIVPSPGEDLDNVTHKFEVKLSDGKLGQKGGDL